VINLNIPDLFDANTNPDGRRFFLDAWFDWNGNGIFENNDVERRRFASSGVGRTELSNGPNPIRDVAADPANNIVQQFGISVPADAQLGETYARFRLSEVDIVGADGPVTTASGGAVAGEIEDYRLIVTNNPFQNPTNAADVNATGVVTPLDALEIINLLADQPTGQTSIDLSGPLPDNMPQFPDANADGSVTVGDILEVINFLAEFGGDQEGNGESAPQGELIQSAQIASGFLPVASGGVLAGATTLAGDALINDALTGAAPTDAPLAAKPSGTTADAQSVFDSAATMSLDAIVDDLAEDTNTTRQAASGEGDLVDQDGTANLDRLFADL
jgi:hypothetical protein